MAVARPVEVLEPPPRTIVLPPPPDRRLLWACVALAVLSAGLGLTLYRTVRTARVNTPEPAPRFWKAFFGERRQTRIILPTPVFFSYSRQDVSSVMVRDTSINEFADRNQAPLFGELDRKMGSPQLAQNYTVTSDTFAAVNLVRYLDRFAFPARLRSSADARQLDTENVIAIGTWDRAASRPT